MMRFPDAGEREKRARLIALLDDGMVQVHVDARRDDVEVPDHLRDDPVLALNLSRRFQLDVFEVGPLAVRASLSFNGERHLCVLPWHAIWRMQSPVTGEVQVFEDAVPPELMAAARAIHDGAELDEAAEGVPADGRVLGPETDGLDGEGSEEPDGGGPEDDDPDPEPPPGPRRPALRIVK